MKKMHNTFRYIVFIVFTSLALPVLFCSTKVAGGSEIGNPLVLTGVVTDSLGYGIKDVKLFLIDIMETDPFKLTVDSYPQTLSDADGVYRFTGVYDGVYSLFGYDISGTKMLLKTIKINGNENQYNNDTLVTEPNTLQACAYVIVKYSDCSMDSNEFYFIPGTTIRSDIDSCGEYVIKCPSSVVDIILYRKDTVHVIGNNVSLSPGQWLDLTGNSYTVTVPKIISGVLSGSIGRTYFFSAGEITLGPNHPVQYRFDWANAISQWSLSSQGSHVWTESGNYQIRVQARSYRDTSFVSEWSDSVLVRIN